MISESDLVPFDSYQLCDSPESGAVLQFVGVVRNHTLNPKKVLGLEYQAHEELATAKIKEIVAESIVKFSLQKAHCVHRVGELPVGGLAIVVTTSGAHREEVYAANRYIVDRVKYEAPIWKKELFEDGTSEWGRNSGVKPDYIKD